MAIADMTYVFPPECFSSFNPQYIVTCRYHSRIYYNIDFGSLREYMGHFRYKWLNYYVRMSKDVARYPHERF